MLELELMPLETEHPRRGRRGAALAAALVAGLIWMAQAAVPRGEVGQRGDDARGPKSTGMAREDGRRDRVARYVRVPHPATSAERLRAAYLGRKRGVPVVADPEATSVQIVTVTQGER